MHSGLGLGLGPYKENSPGENDTGATQLPATTPLTAFCPASLILPSNHCLMSENSDKSTANGASETKWAQDVIGAFRFSGERIAQMRIDSRPDCLRLVRAVVQEAGDASGCNAECVSQIVMAVDEACQNIIRHAYLGDPGGEIVVDIGRQNDSIVVHLLDFAAPVDVSTIKPRRLDELKPGGLGTHFIHACMDECGFLTPPSGAGNCLRLVKKIR
jgi:anti-sigma regulatory factor (Ser/Thr protein kinase)